MRKPINVPYIQTRLKDVNKKRMKQPKEEKEIFIEKANLKTRAFKIIVNTFVWPMIALAWTASFLLVATLGALVAYWGIWLYKFIYALS